MLFQFISFRFACVYCVYSFILPQFQSFSHCNNFILNILISFSSLCNVNHSVIVMLCYLIFSGSCPKICGAFIYLCIEFSWWNVSSFAAHVSSVLYWFFFHLFHWRNLVIVNFPRKIQVKGPIINTKYNRWCV